MKITLPSNGLLGLRSVDLRPPTYNDLRNVHSLNQEDSLLKAQFVKELVKDLDLSKITKFDLDYLFTVAAFSLTFNRMSYSLTCPSCGEEIKESVFFGSQDVRDLNKKGYPYKQIIDGEEFVYHILSAQQEVDAWEYAITQEEEEEAYQDAAVLFIFGKTLSDIPWVRNLPASIYISALAYQQFNFHGVLLDEKCECPHCKNKVNVRVSLPADVVKVNIGKLMASFVDVADEVSFADFCKMTVVEYKAFLDALNSKSK